MTLFGIIVIVIFFFSLIFNFVNDSPFWWIILTTSIVIGLLSVMIEVKEKRVRDVTNYEKVITSEKILIIEDGKTYEFVEYQDYMKLKDEKQINFFLVRPVNPYGFSFEDTELKYEVMNQPEEVEKEVEVKNNFQSK